MLDMPNGASDAALGRQMECVERARRVASECADPWLAPRYIVRLVSWLFYLACRLRLRGELRDAAAAAKEAHELSARWLGADAMSTRRMSLVHLLLLLHQEQVCAQQKVRSDRDLAEMGRRGWQRSLAELQDLGGSERPATAGAAEVRVLLSLHYSGIAGTTLCLKV
eukprot:1152405-Pelagomonas_calceolata.AAC.2